MTGGGQALTCAACALAAWRGSQIWPSLRLPLPYPTPLTHARWLCTQRRCSDQAIQLQGEPSHIA